MFVCSEKFRNSGSQNIIKKTRQVQRLSAHTKASSTKFNHTQNVHKFKKKYFQN